MARMLAMTAMAAIVMAFAVAATVATADPTADVRAAQRSVAHGSAFVTEQLATALSGLSASGGGAAASGKAAGRLFGASQSTSTRCTEAATSDAARNLQAQCGSLDFSAAFNINNSSASARAEVQRFCSSGCQDAFRSVLSSFSECFPPQLTQITGILDAMCSRHEGEYCAWNLRSVSALSNCGDRRTEALCVADGACRFDNATRSCDLRSTTAILERLCTPCFDRYIFAIGAVLAATGSASVAGSSASVSAEASAQQRELVVAKNMMCSRVEDTWCMNVFEEADARVFDVSATSTLGLAEAEAGVDRLCNATGKRCLNKVFDFAVETRVERLVSTYETCVRFRRSTVGVNFCVEQFRSEYATVTSAAATLSLVCGRNDAGLSCGKAAHRLVRDGCYATIALGARLSGSGSSSGSAAGSAAGSVAGSCNTTCAAWLTRTSTELGCCWGLYRRMMIDAQYPVPVGLPSRLEAAFRSRRANVTLTGVTEATTPMWAEVQFCNVTAGNGFDTAATITAMGARCAAVAAVQKELQLVGMRWSRLSGNATLRARLTAALTADVARSLGTADENIVNATLRADASQQLTASTSSGRRQSSSASAGTTFEFGISGDSSAEASESAATFESKKASKSIAVTTTAEVVSSDCADCVGSPTAAPGQTAAPPPTGALFASLVGADTSGTSSPSASGAAGTAAAGAVAAAALVVAAVAAASV